jgi:mannose-1-phosphate guanylyltransferase
VPREEVASYGVVCADAQGRIASFQEKPSPEEAKSTLASTGIYIFEPAVLDLIPAGEVYDIGAHLFPTLVSRQLPFYVQNRDFHWIDIGRVSDYWSVLQRVLRGEIPDMRIPGRELRPGVWVGLNVSIPWDQVTIEGPVVIGSSVRIEPGAVIKGPCWIGHGCVIKAGAQVEHSVLFEYVRVASNMRFFEMVVSRQYCVNRRGETLYRGDDTSLLRWGDARVESSHAL